MKGNDANPSSVSNASRHESDSGETGPTVSGDDNFKEFMRWALSWEMREIREVELENGLRGVEVRGVITTYVNPHPTGRGDRYVDRRLVDDYGAWHIDELTEGQLADYMADIEGGPMSRMPYFKGTWEKTIISEEELLADEHDQELKENDEYAEDEEVEEGDNTTPDESTDEVNGRQSR
ncbi:hypothetical protein SCP_1401420 [Sparassis crispa]|uniref:Uncharacterized protein n=1 Tax=Sparassis crispa TaxID=139825 RepID=A0A401H2S7_9APHY|nr:hypothetical protein SCP_1401420 [Sparassis crispa]GBE88737.1 hypothetical protein SCP_1401420 [Sparassis crispa]